MAKRPTPPKLWNVWGLRKGWHPLEEGAWHPLFQYRTEARARRAAEELAHINPPSCRHGSMLWARARCDTCKHSAGIEDYARFKAVRPGSTPVNPAKLRPARRRKSCLRCDHQQLPKDWSSAHRCLRCGWVPKRWRVRSAA